jgi:uncharacterized protein involved in exopolysaccharide biosynthesis
VNDLSIDLQVFDLAFFTNCRVISGPTLPNRHIAPRRKVIVISACFLSFFLLVLFVFARHWWRVNKNRITSLK